MIFFDVYSIRGNIRKIYWYFESNCYYFSSIFSTGNRILFYYEYSCT